MGKIKWVIILDLSKREKIGLTLFISIVLLLISVMYFNRTKAEDLKIIGKNSSLEAEAPLGNNADKSTGIIKVYIMGEIKKPGVYTLNEGDRAERLIELAGGYTSSADSTYLNLAMKLKDEDYIKVPSKALSTAAVSSFANIDTKPAESSSKLININTATLEELKSLPRIGDAIAQRIIDYREKIGSFKKIENITDVSGIGPKMFENIKALITVNWCCIFTCLYYKISNSIRFAEKSLLWSGGRDKNG